VKGARLYVFFSDLFSSLSTPQALHASDFIVEAVNESEPLKKSIFSMLDRVAPPGATLASNTSSISITRIAAATARPQCVVGMHFMNPVPAMPLVELVKGIATSDRAAAEATALAEHLGKTLIASLDRPGFLVNRCLMPMINEAFYCLMEGVGTAEDIDKGMKFGTHHPMGPLLLADYIGE
jgi:3-hydroxybutyryl-CoA dehydrogenase